MQRDCLSGCNNMNNETVQKSMVLYPILIYLISPQSSLLCNNNNNKWAIDSEGKVREPLEWSLVLLLFTLYHTIQRELATYAQS